MIHQHDTTERPEDEADAAHERPSKSQRKREMQSRQKLGEALLALAPAQLKKLTLPEELREAVVFAQGLKNEARRRQLQFIGRLMRDIDPESIQAGLDALQGNSRAETARLQRLERLREDFLTDEQAAGRILDAWPHADMQHLRSLRRNALNERKRGKPPRAYRELFRVLRQLDDDSPAS